MKKKVKQMEKIKPGKRQGTGIYAKYNRKKHNLKRLKKDREIDRDYNPESVDEERW